MYFSPRLYSRYVLSPLIVEQVWIISPRFKYVYKLFWGRVVASISFSKKLAVHRMLPFWTSRACTCRFILSSDYSHMNCDLLPFNTCFQRGCCLIFWKHLAYAWYVMVMYLACDTFMENHLTTLDSTFFLKLMPEIQGHSARLTVYVQTPWPQDVFTNQIWDS